MNEVLKAIAARSSTRAYTPEKLTEAELDALLQAGLQAPTAANRQEIHISVVDGSNPLLGEIEEEKNRLFGVQAPAATFHYDAPTVLFLSADASFPWSALDAGIAVENIALAAEALGLGSVIIGCVKGALTGTRAAEFASALSIPQGYEFEIAIAVGHKAADKVPHEYSMADHISRI